jgi:hypothetical protein
MYHIAFLEGGEHNEAGSGVVYRLGGVVVVSPRSGVAAGHPTASCVAGCLSLGRPTQSASNAE